MVWIWWWIGSAKLSSGWWTLGWSDWIVRCWSNGLLWSSTGTWGTWALAFPLGSCIISGFWILDSLPSDIRHLTSSFFFFYCAVQSRILHCILHFVVIIMCAAFTWLWCFLLHLHDCVFPAFYVLCSSGLKVTFAGLTLFFCRDDIHFCILIALQFSLETLFYILCDGTL